uniref:EOG090X0BA1 n=1 Tax=Ceriodaphnia reticulata TaxID=302197 RepID=A0A4Y7LU61_9CRUS|nr:EOG090X0BA1 [Ceriodaphnia reticulata]
MALSLSQEKGVSKSSDSSSSSPDDQKPFFFFLFFFFLRVLWGPVRARAAITAITTVRSGLTPARQNHQLLLLLSTYKFSIIQNSRHNQIQSRIFIFWRHSVKRKENNFVNNSKVILQLRQRALQWTAWRKSTSELASNNLLLMMLLDLILGLCFAKLFHSLGGANEVLEMFLDSVKVIADNLQLLIEWLMGVPVGLKLNRPLSTVLGKFFLYHLYLWKTYIDIIRPVVSIVIFISSTFGLIGLSFQIALLSDLITMASLHCYCFYVYAARLYGVTLHGLRATLRMFGGRKWNPLRSRFDSGDFAWDQLCVGMFIFSSLLLLLPTLLVYYVVFLALRLGVLLLQGTLKRIIWLINSVPNYSLLLWILGSPSLAGDVLFEAMPGRESTLKLVWIKLPLIESMKRSLNPSAPEYPRINWTRRLNEMVSGGLIYPL